MPIKREEVEFKRRGAPLPSHKSLQSVLVPTIPRGNEGRPAPRPGPASQSVSAARDPGLLHQQLETCLTELVRCYRHGAAGRRCTGIVHLMNSPLQALSFQMELLEMRSQEEHRYLEDCPFPATRTLLPWCDYRLGKYEQVRHELHNFQTLTRRIIAQGLHEENQQRTFLDLKRLWQDELELYQADLFFRHEVKKVFRLEAELPPIHGHYIDFSQSFRNLVDNALEAMEAAPRRVLTVETGCKEGQIWLRIGDTGPGIPAENLPRVFEPFFTTKNTPDRPDHAGLGLFMARRLLAPYGGILQIASRPGRTWVTLSLPVGAAAGQP